MKLSLNKSFYNQKEVKETISFFEKNGIGSLTYKEKNKFFIVEFKKINEEFKNIAIDEFCNSLVAFKKRS